MLKSLKRLVPVLLLAALLPACATITTGTSQSIAVMTEPPGASCTLSRDGGVIAVVNPTPGTVTVSKSTRDIAVSCPRPGHLPGVASEQSREGFFTQRQAETRRIFDERIRAVDTGCGPGERQACSERMQALSRERDEELARLNALRLVTRVGA
ncbi:hypothetical protein KTR66_24000 [Roseococcus sp. SDR]|uniref:hypothetical protein n=1 Tax=Roseococcus sp. SDR TaxID=2835532 RepID=UPI001BCC2B28|nr:hypothetical protein [Roseococcus sp. SDR]MBS7793067.1 hypothetical protein [Roseococcus sp. SDR]MBV1848381.1 hypothetical protein [Roseococcus sp. SDR]